MATTSRGYELIPSGAAPDVPLRVNPVLEAINDDVQDVEDAALAAAEAAAAAAWTRPALANATNLDTLDIPGVHPIVGFTAANSMTPKPPVVATSNYTHAKTGPNNAYQRQDTTAKPFQSWDRRKDGGVWSHPRRIDQAEPVSLVSLSRSAGTAYTESATDGHVKWPFRVGTTLEQVAFNIENLDDRTNTAYTGAVNITGVWVGKAEIVAGALTGKYSGAPTQVVNAFGLPVTGAKVTSSDITRLVAKFDPHDIYYISAGFTTDGTPYHRSFGGCFRNGLSSQAGSTNPNTMTLSKYAPFSCWLTVRSKAPRVAMIGDSHGTGNNADLPVFQSPLNLWAAQNGVIPINVSHGGSALADWRSVNQYKYQKHALVLDPTDSIRSYGQAAVRADAAIIQVGQNGIYAGATLAQMQDDLLTTMTAVRSMFGPNVWLATIMPRNGAGLEAYDAVRIQYNEWLRGLPGMAVGLIDFAAAIADPANPSKIDVRYVDPVEQAAGIGTHLNTAGCAKLAAVIPSGLGRNVTY